jgi:protein involved in polysaccharide export with SLBB domain
VEQQQLDKFIRAQEQSLLAEAAGVTAGAAELAAGDKGDIAATQAQVTVQRRELLRSLASSVAVGRLALKLDEPELLRGTPQDIMLENGDALAVPQIPTSVLILGAVRNSTAVLYDDRWRNVEGYVNQAGGATRDADMTQAYILKADGTAISSFVKLRKLEPGDAIIVPISTEPKVRTLPMLRDIATILSGFTLPFATVVALLRK